MASVTFTLEDGWFTSGGFEVRWDVPNNARPVIPAALAAGNSAIYLRVFVIPKVNANNLFATLDSQTSTSNVDLSDVMETEGTIQVLASDGTSIVFPGPDAAANLTQDSSSIYSWFPPAPLHFQLRTFSATCGKPE